MERWEIVEFHDRILSFFNRGYYTELHDLPLRTAWWADPRVAEVKREIIEFLKRRMSEGHFGFKDPRTVRLMPLWHQIFHDLKLAPKIVFCLRNPAQVAGSLMARDRLPIDAGELRWFSYLADFFRYTIGSEICVLKYETWFDDQCTNPARCADRDKEAREQIESILSQLIGFQELQRPFQRAVEDHVVKAETLDAR